MKRKTRNTIQLILYVLLVFSLLLPMFKWDADHCNFFGAARGFWASFFSVLFLIVLLFCVLLASASLLKEYTPKVPDKFGILQKWNGRWSFLCPAAEIIFFSLMMMGFWSYGWEEFYSTGSFTRYCNVNLSASIPILLLTVILVVGEIDAYRRFYTQNPDETYTRKTWASVILRVIGILGIAIGTPVVIGVGFSEFVIVVAVAVYLVGHFLVEFPSEEIAASANTEIQPDQSHEKEPVHSETIASEKDREASPLASDSSNADAIRKYNELLSDGIITQEEFDAKKKQLLGL